MFESFVKSFLAVLRPTIIISAFGIIYLVTLTLVVTHIYCPNNSSHYGLVLHPSSTSPSSFSYISSSSISPISSSISSSSAILASSWMWRRWCWMWQKWCWTWGRWCWMWRRWCWMWGRWCWTWGRWCWTGSSTAIIIAISPSPPPSKSHSISITSSLVMTCSICCDVSMCRTGTHLLC